MFLIADTFIPVAVICPGDSYISIELPAPGAYLRTLMTQLIRLLKISVVVAEELDAVTSSKVTNIVAPLYVADNVPASVNSLPVQEV